MPLMQPIARSPVGAYPAPMASAVLRLIALVALVLMPLSMASAPASAQAAASAPAGHCDEHQKQKPADAPSVMKMHCTGCTALPAMEAPQPFAELRPQAPKRLALVEFIDGIEPETATPPPRLS